MADAGGSFLVLILACVLVTAWGAVMTILVRISARLETRLVMILLLAWWIAGALLDLRECRLVAPRLALLSETLALMLLADSPPGDQPDPLPD